MKKTLKLILLSLGILTVMAFSFGCTEDFADPDNDTSSLPDQLTISAGFLNEKYMENDIMTLEFGYIKGDNDAYTGNLKLQTDDDTLFDSLTHLKHYMIAYDGNYNLVFIENNPVIEDLILQGQDLEDTDELETEIIDYTEDVDLDELTLLDSYSVDIYNDGEDETISMYTDAEKDPEGNIMWDDGQTWKIIVEGTDKNFLLFDDYLQLASMEFFVYTVDDDFYISTISSGTANLTMENYKYNRENETFEKTVESNTSGNVNMIYKSISDF